jgi:hypothetical protein
LDQGVSFLLLLFVESSRLVTRLVRRILGQRRNGKPPAGHNRQNGETS